MAEFCKECFLKTFLGHDPDEIIMSTYLDDADIFICEGCGESKPYVVFCDVPPSMVQAILRASENKRGKRWRETVDNIVTHINEAIADEIKRGFEEYGL